MNYLTLTASEKQKLLAEMRERMNLYVQKGLKLDMSRGKPSKDQLDLSNGLYKELDPSLGYVGKQDYRNYGINDGIPEIKKLFAELAGVGENEIIVAYNASLNLMYDSVQRAMQFGVSGCEPWNKQGKIKWICPVPGYDRHFAVTELFGIEMINVDMKDDGPDMDKVEELIKDPSVKGMWNVPKYSNPTGVVYSDAVVERLAKMKPAAPDFRLMWDNAYMVHALYEQREQANILALAKKYGNEDMIYGFGSTSKITFAGAGVAFMYSSEKNIAEIKKQMNIQSIGPDKMVQLAHYRFFKNVEGIYALMEKHAAIMRPKFEAVIEILEKELGDTGIAKWTKPEGGYFISVDLTPGTAKKTVALAKEMGVVFTGAGATYPYKKDPNDSNLRIAPSLPPIDELVEATHIFAVAAKIAYLSE